MYRVTSTCVEPSHFPIPTLPVVQSYLHLRGAQALSSALQFLYKELPPLAWSLGIRICTNDTFKRVTSTCVEPRSDFPLGIPHQQSYLHLRGAQENIQAIIYLPSELPPLAWSLGAFVVIAPVKEGVTSTCVEPRMCFKPPISQCKSYLHLRGAQESIK